MKKLLAVILVFVMSLSLIGTLAKDVTLTPAEIALKSGDDFVAGPQRINNLDRGDWFGFKGVDLTGMKSLSVTVKNSLSSSGGNNGDTWLVMTDSPENGEIIGALTFLPTEEYDTIVKTSLKEVSGTHDLYFYSLYGDGLQSYLSSYDITLSSEVYVNDTESEKVSKYPLTDLYSDTWVGVDNFGRAVSTYEETGGLKEGVREVGMMYWNWRVDAHNRTVAVIPEIIANAIWGRTFYGTILLTTK